MSGPRGWSPIGSTRTRSSGHDQPEDAGVVRPAVDLGDGRGTTPFRAWRNIARVGDRRNALASLIVRAYHTADKRGA